VGLTAPSTDFALGAGFALVENLYYLNLIENSNLLTWLLRGFDTSEAAIGKT